MAHDLTVAVAQPHSGADDVSGNARRHAVAVRDARARLVVFPELSLTGYQLDAAPVSPDAPALAEVIVACQQTGAIALAGGLGICKDTGVTAHVTGVAAVDIDLYVAGLVHHAHEVAEQDARARHIARRCRSFVAFASFAGPTGEGYAATAGNSAVWDPDGRPLARASGRAGDVVTARLSLEHHSHPRRRIPDGPVPSPRSP